ncbi:MAG: VacJ family lipoprotein [Desulfobacterales bacterium]|nr:VacJ family lipoprotein [Desulfobacterales bacterium]
MKKIPALLLCIIIFSIATGYVSAEDDWKGDFNQDIFLLAQAEEELQTDEYDLGDDLFDEYDTQAEDSQMVADPLYYFNYAMYTVNDYLYFYGLKPIAQGYKFVVPTPVRSGISNFFHNLLFPVRFVNNILQGKAEGAANEFSAFFVNSTIGILGFNNFAQKHMDIQLYDEDLGQTLGSYNIGDGFYLVLPVLGPSTLRDAVGRAGDWFITPVNYVEPWELSWGLWALDKTNRTSFRIGDYEALKDASLDPYVAIRNAYIQNRRSLIKQ